MRDALKLAQEVFAGREQAGGELSALQRAAQLAAEPLIALGKSVAATAISYLGSSTAVAIASGLGVLRLGLGATATLSSAAADHGRKHAWALALHGVNTAVPWHALQCQLAMLGCPEPRVTLEMTDPGLRCRRCAGRHTIFTLCGPAVCAAVSRQRPSAVCRRGPAPVPEQPEAGCCCLLRLHARCFPVCSEGMLQTCPQMYPSLGALTLPPCVTFVFALTPATLSSMHVPAKSHPDPFRSRPLELPTDGIQ